MTNHKEIKKKIFKKKRKGQEKEKRKRKYQTQP